MALNVNFNTPATSNTGASLDSVHIRLTMFLMDNEIQAEVQYKIYVDEVAFLAGRDPINVDEIPVFLSQFIVDITPAQYADVDMLNAHNQLAGFIEDGENHPNWPTWPVDPNMGEFLGIKDIDPLNEAVVVMPT